MRMVGTFCTKVFMPTTFASFGRSCFTTSSAGFLLSYGLRAIVMRPLLPAGLKLLAPTNDMIASTLGSWRTMSATWRCRSTMPWKETSCGPSVNTNSCPESSLGRKPLGARENSTPVATTIARNTSIVKRWCRSTQRSVQP